MDGHLANRFPCFRGKIAIDKREQSTSRAPARHCRQGIRTSRAVFFVTHCFLYNIFPAQKMRRQKKMFFAEGVSRTATRLSTKLSTDYVDNKTSGNCRARRTQRVWSCLIVTRGRLRLSHAFLERRPSSRRRNQLPGNNGGSNNWQSSCLPNHNSPCTGLRIPRTTITSPACGGPDAPDALRPGNAVCTALLAYPSERVVSLGKNVCHRSRTLALA